MGPKNWVAIRKGWEPLCRCSHICGLWRDEKIKSPIFLLQIYPDAAHNMHSVRSHFYLSMENFLETCYQANQHKVFIFFLALFSGKWKV